MTPLNFVLVGVGGQGILLASDLLCQAGMAVGYDVKKTDVHGMAQRGGSVVSHVRLADRVYSPMVPTGAADFLLGFEKLEACRSAGQLRCGGVAVVSDEAIPTLPLAAPSMRYPDDAALYGVLRARAAELTVVPAALFAARLGNPRVANLVLLGGLSRHLDIPPSAWERAIAERVPARFRDINLRAFALGRQASSP